MVKKLKYKGKTYPVRVSYYALKKTREDLGIISVEDNFDSYETLLFHALVRGAKVEGIDFDLKREDMEDMMDYVFFDFVGMLPEFFPEAPKANKSKSKSKKEIGKLEPTKTK